MKFVHPHQLSTAEIRRRVDAFIPQFLDRYSGRVSDPHHEWDGDTLRFSGKALSMRIAGSMLVTNDDIAIEVGVPLMARPFESAIKARIIAHLEELLS
jgi:hypothetical protein